MATEDMNRFQYFAVEWCDDKSNSGPKKRVKPKGG